MWLIWCWRCEIPRPLRRHWRWLPVWPWSLHTRPRSLWFNSELWQFHGWEQLWWGSQSISKFSGAPFTNIAGTSSPSYWQQVEEQAPKPVGWMMCFLLMTLVPVQKLCVNIYLYICVHIPYTSSVIGCIYNGSVIQYRRSCTPSCSTGECAVPGLNTMLFSLVYQLCLALW